MQLVLASQSPRRRELLANAGFQFRVLAPGPDAEDGIELGESPAELVTRLAFQKAHDVAQRIDRGLVLGCDTVVECRGEILGKPENREHAAEMLRLLRGQRHHVHSGICLWHRPGDKYTTQTDVTQLRMESATDAELERYLDTALWVGKAGAFGYQDGLDWLHVEHGSESNVVGLPMELLEKMLDDIPSFSRP